MTAPVLTPDAFACLLEAFGPLLWVADDQAGCLGGTLLREGHFFGALPAGPTLLICDSSWSEALELLPLLNPPVSPPSNCPEDALLTTEQIAALLQTTTTQITRLTSERGLPHYRLGHRTLRFSKPEVLDWLRQIARVAPKEQTHGSSQTERRLLRRFSIHQPKNRPETTIQAFDWTGHNKKEGY
jgi:excisionase family DNA binding protein